MSSKRLDEALHLQQTGKLAGAEQVYREILQSDAGNANAWCCLGMLRCDQRRFGEADLAFRKAILLQPNFPEAYSNLGNVLSLQNRVDEALQQYDQALRLKPDYVGALKNKGIALYWNGRLEEALATYRKAVELDPNDASSHKNLGVALLRQGDFAQGWPEYEWRRKVADYRQPTWPQPLWDGTPLNGRSILLVAEQGLGDTIHFIRYAAELKKRFACRVIVACQASLLPLLRSCPGIDLLISQDDCLPPFDVYAPLPSLPGILHDTAGSFPCNIPYLWADDGVVHRWREELKGVGLRIGIVWQGSRIHSADAKRSAPLQQLLPLSQLQGIRWFSLQKGDGVEQLESMKGRWEIVPLGDRLDQSGGAFMDTAAVLTNLDLLITIDTAIAHVAGALGVPVWLALSYVADWRWLRQREDTPWYPNTRLFRQPRLNDWASVFERMAEELIRRFPGVRWKTWTDCRLWSNDMNCLTAGRHGLMLYNHHDRYIGRSIERYGEFSEGEVELFRQVIRPGSVVVEAGANIGAHTLLFSDLVGDSGVVHAFEPQRVVFQTLCANMALNSKTNVHCHREALGEQPGFAFIPALDYRQENNFGGVVLEGQREGEKVPLITIDSLALPRCDFLKADVEGMELRVLRGATETLRKLRPILYVENDRQDKSPALIEFLLSLGYDLYWHLPLMFNPKNYFHNPVNEFGQIVSINMLGIHSSVKSSLAGFRRITSPGDDWRNPVIAAT